MSFFSTYIAVSETMQLTNGTYAAPSLTMYNDSDTGIYHTTADDGDIHFASQGAHAATLNAAGLNLTGTFAGALGANNNATYHFTDDPAHLRLHACRTLAERRGGG
jgi:hypothetical protein